MRPLPLVLAATALSQVSCGGTRSSAAEADSSGVVAATAQSSAERTFATAAGTWHWSQGDSTCTGNAHRISFSTGRDTMLLTHQQPIDTATGQTVSRYRVLAAGDRVLPGMPMVIRAELAGESRRTADGDLVVWDLVLASDNRYHWHRTDWPEGAVTMAVIRCDGTRPLETYTPQAAP